ncbi:MAG: AzlC family ABC transporter permease [Gammaproteobacteria bacterium]|nr:AzlC family ABC transporter permease [Gammaproteobacteria bacterium]
MGVFAWGLVTGLAMVKSGLTLAQAFGMALLAYAGSAQLAALPLIAGAAPVWVVVLTATVVNLRFVIYSLALRPTLGTGSRSRRLALGYLTGDIPFVKFMTLLERGSLPAQRIAWFAGASACNWLAWQAGSILGIVAGGAIPADWGLALAGTLALLSLVVPLCTRMPVLAGVLVAGITVVVAHGLPLRLGVLLAVVCGIAAAVAVEAHLRPEGTAA